jgi:hypothetical protein
MADTDILFVEVEMYHNAPPCTAGGEVHHPYPHFMVLDKDDEAGEDRYQVRGTREDLQHMAILWMYYAIDGIKTIGADDGYYDYYPDYLRGLKQLCEAIDDPAPYKTARRQAFKERYDGDPEAVDLIPEWGRS